MDSEPVQVIRKSRGTVQLTLNRPAKRNALNVDLLRCLCEAGEGASKDPTVRTIVLSGAGPVFCAGLDLAEAADISLASQSAELVARTLRLFSESPKVTIAAAQGAAVAGGAGLLLACDLAVASEDLVLGFTEVRRGLVAGLIMTFVRRKLKDADARELLLTGELVSARRALEMGMVNRVVSKDCLQEEAEGLAEAVAKGGPEALRLTKSFFQSLWPSSIDADLVRAIKLHKEVRTGQEAQEGIRSFLEKRPPRWSLD